jgi:hypothetical protein
VGKRGDNAFKRNDAIRAIESARAAGIEPAAMEVILGADGSTTFRVFGSAAGVTATTPDNATMVWQTEIEKLKKATPKGSKGQ